MNNSSLDNVFHCIDRKKSFILEGGAGSGKTWTLIESLRHILDKYSDVFLANNQRIVCITFTNVAKDEISERIYHNPLVHVSTIHDFLWDVIKNFQSELKKILIDYNNQESNKPVENLKAFINDLVIEYSQYGRNFEKGRISHDEVLNFSGKIFGSYPKISKIVSAKYPFILVDEFQDTEPVVVKLLLDRLLKQNRDSFTIGFFGDSMQKIYNQGIGRIEHKMLEKVIKEDNYRCSKAVIELLNKIRTELQQKASGDNLDGSIAFFHCNNSSETQEGNFEKVLAHLHIQHNWPKNSYASKILLLTHKGIASNLDYPNLLNVYSKQGPYGRDRLYDKDDVFVKFLFNMVEQLCKLYREKQYGEIISLVGKEKCMIEKHADKENLKKLIDGLEDARTKTIRDVLIYVFDNNLFSKPKEMNEFEMKISGDNLDESLQKKKEFYDALMQVQYQEIVNLDLYIEENTPFSTKHGVKGAEFDNVLVVIDDKAWNQYNFNYLFSNQTNKKQYERTRNLFYVCCSRVKNNLAVLTLSKMDNRSMETIKAWFGENNIYDVNGL